MNRDRIEKSIHLQVPVERVWRALTNPKEFGEWFRVKIDSPFIVGQQATGFITHPGYEHVRWTVVIKSMDANRHFSFTWHPYAIEPDVDYSKEQPTLVEFKLEEVPGGTHLLLTESGFDKVPEARRSLAFRMNEGGWEQQMKNIEAYLRSKS